MISLRRHASVPRESIVPMINVAFLLLIFFLMTAVIVPPPPIDLDVPVAENEGRQDGLDLFVNSKGVLVTADGVAAALPEVSGQALHLHADRGMDARRLARILARLKEAGPTSISLVTRKR